MPQLTTRVRHGIATVRTLAEAGIIAPIRPDRLIRVAGILKRMGATPASGYAVAATRYPDAPAISDERGRLSFQEVHARTNALAHAFADDGLKPGDRIAIMCRNHRWFIDTFIATAKLGADVQLINTSFSGPQVAGVVAQEQPDAIVFDDEFAPLMEQAGVEKLKRYVAWTEPDAPVPDVHGRVEDLITGGDPTDPPVPPRIGRIIILTSGTTGAPKGAARSHPRSLSIAAALLDRIPLRAREPTLIASPLFHSWGLGNMSLGISLSSTLVLRRRFDPLETVQTLAQERCTAFIAVPVMLQRILELPPETTSAYDLSRLRVVSLSGSALAPALAAAWMDRFGETIYNLYGSTEVAWATIATPEDLRAAPGTAGKPPRGTLVRLFDDNDRPVAQGNTGRIFVGNELAMEGYTGGTSKQSIGGMLSSGDVGHFDSNGRLFVDGRDDDMIVSGGENVFPAEVEDLLCGHPAIREAAVLGVPDERYGQRLRAYVVRFQGAELEADEVRAYVKENLAPYKAPRDVEFVDELPRTATGKVLKRALPTG